MKKKIFGAVLIAVMALAAGWNFNQSKNEVELSDLTLANIDALARRETDAEYEKSTCCRAITENKKCYGCDGPTPHSYSVRI